ncbi:TIGR04282 family arsenosugar biosynthesis glycosyltransferase [Aequorivita echinoideorum]|uniref:DUF2064 domain-containing protein n=1 Tax=Aequorivita echinoideorum TaxID=1549647 RepID=A0ABS5S2K1_9FLAO|nr:DUF2064 domain-containing protein [Aequorivita echinoideorum]MBT0607432.1 DUF2064 domain-containing protein [Aequorivita echinoideorum]
MTKQATAILIFANSAQAEASYKPFSKNSKLFSELNKDTLEKVKKSGLPYFHFSEKEQIGDTFGERYINAIKAVYNSGFENVITIGNDTPLLQTSHIAEAAENLRKNPLVLGPSRDGGYYLMGLNIAYFEPESFLKLPWQTGNLRSALCQLLLKKNAQIIFLETLVDIDSIADVELLKNSFRKIRQRIFKILVQLLTFNKRKIYFKNFLVEKIISKTYFNKGSPSLA